MAEAFPLWVVGVLLVILGSIGQNLGNNLMSLGHAQQRALDEAAAEEEERKSHKPGIDNGDQTLYEQQQGENKRSDSVDAQQKESKDLVMSNGKPTEGGGDKKDDEPPKGTWWFIGTVCFVTGSLSTFVAFGFAAASLLAALESIQFVTNVIFAKTVHGIHVTPQMYISTFAIVGGNVLVVVFSEHAAKIYDSKKILELYAMTGFHIYLVFFAVAFTSTEVAYRVYYAARMKAVEYWNHNVVEPMSFCAASALVGAFAVINAKCLSMLIQVSGDSSRNRNEFARAELYVILVTWIIFVTFWLRRLDQGLELYPPSVIPVLHCLFIFFSIVCGGIFFEEFKQFDYVQWIGFSLGVVFILGGVYGLASAEVVHEHDNTAVKPIDNDEEAALGGLDATKGGGLVIKPGSEKDGALGPSSDGKPDELDSLVNPPSPSSKRKIVKRSIPDDADIALPA